MVIKDSRRDPGGDGNVLSQCQYPGFDSVLQFCKMLPLWGTAQGTGDLSVLFLTATWESTVISK